MFQVAFNVMAGYAFAKLRFRGRDALFRSMLAALVIPIQVSMMPLFLFMKTLGLVNTWAGVVIPSMAGIFGIFLNRKNIIVILMSIELILLAVNINLVAFSAYLGDMVGQVFAMFVLTVAAGEAAIGLAILVIYFRGRGTIDVDDVNRMQG